MVRFPNCKINLGLYITRKRDDGYHDLETVFFPVPVRDALEVVPAEVTRLHISGKAVAGNEDDNLVLKAYRLLKEQYGSKLPPLGIHLLKAIPMGAGMGGGSADGAFMLQLLNDHCNLKLSQEELAEYALKLGSDCPFFIYNKPQFAQGRGEQLQPVHIDLSAYSIQLICPDVHVSTAKAFSMITPKPAPFDLRRLSELPISEWKANISNDFEQPIFQQEPVLAEIKQQLYAGGAIYASMSGSGSTIYGIFEKGKKADIVVNVQFEAHFIV
jgi:4-diphosphocytidyl-2-C-methyl-D-erythritol kinase